MLSVVNFMYCGEVSVAQEDLNTFLSVAEELQVKGLTQNQNNTDCGENTGTASPIRRDVKLKKPSVANCGSQESSTRSQSYRKFSAAPMENEDMDDIQEVVPVKSDPGSSSMVMYQGHYQDDRSGDNNNNAKKPCLHSL